MGDGKSVEIGKQGTELKGLGTVTSIATTIIREQKGNIGVLSSRTACVGRLWLCLVDPHRSIIRIQSCNRTLSLAVNKARFDIPC